MSSYTRDILEELEPLMSKDTDPKKMAQAIELLTKNYPKIDIDSTFRRELRNTILSPSPKKKIIPLRSSFYRFLPVFGTVFACMIFGLSFWKIFFQTEQTATLAPIELQREEKIGA